MAATMQVVATTVTFVVLALALTAQASWVLSDAHMSCQSKCATLDTTCDPVATGSIDTQVKLTRVLTVTVTPANPCSSVNQGTHSTIQLPEEDSFVGSGTCAVVASEPLLCCCNDIKGCAIPEPPPPPPPPPPVGWFLSNLNEDCNAACSRAGGFCNPVAPTFVRTTGTFDFIKNTVLGQSAVQCTTYSNLPGTMTPNFSSDGICNWNGQNSNCPGGNNFRLCCCGYSCPFS